MEFGLLFPILVACNQMGLGLDRESDEKYDEDCVGRHFSWVGQN